MEGISRNHDEDKLADSTSELSESLKQSREAMRNLGQVALSEGGSERIVDRYLERAEISPGAHMVMDTLRDNGYEAYLVGGFVRDALLGKIPKDEDIATNAAPEQTMEVFAQSGHSVLPSGIEFGTVTVMMNNADDLTGYEVTTYRTDGISSDQRHPDQVYFVSSLKEDMARRDFTMNALAFDPHAEGKDRIIDYYDGVEDLKNGVIRAVGDPESRISEDALRMLRAVRFAAQKELTIDQNLAEAIRRHSGEIKQVSGERIGAEITKILLSDHPDTGLANLYELGLLKEISPQLAQLYETEQNNPWHIGNVGLHTEQVLAHTPKNLHIRAAALLHDVGKPATKTTDQNGIDHFFGHDRASVGLSDQILRSMHFKRQDIEHICRLIALHDYPIESTEEGICRFIERHQEVDPSEFGELIVLKLADNAAQNPTKTQDRIEALRQANEIYQEIVATRPYRLKDLALSGRDVMQVNQTRRGETVQLKGKAVGLALDQMLSYVLRHPQHNNSEDLTDFLRGNLKSIRNQSLARKEQK